MTKTVTGDQLLGTVKKALPQRLPTRVNSAVVYAITRVLERMPDQLRLNPSCAR
jgi:hypothetical protein